MRVIWLAHLRGPHRGSPQVRFDELSHPIIDPLELRRIDPRQPVTCTGYGEELLLDTRSGQFRRHDL
jgi:hypothetical protein